MDFFPSIPVKHRGAACSTSSTNLRLPSDFIQSGTTALSSPSAFSVVSSFSTTCMQRGAIFSSLTTVPCTS